MLKLTEKHREYWRRNLNLTLLLLVIWFVVTFVMGGLRGRWPRSTSSAGRCRSTWSAGFAHHLHPHHLVLREPHGQAG